MYEGVSSCFLPGIYSGISPKISSEIALEMFVLHSLHIFKNFFQELPKGPPGSFLEILSGNLPRISLGISSGINLPFIFG